METSLPAYMLAFMIEEAQKKGFEVRADVIAHLGRAAALPLAKVDEFSVSRLARQVTDTATTLLTDLNPDDPRHGLYCCAMFVLMLVDEGRFRDATNQAVLVSMLLMDDVKDDRPRRQRRAAGVAARRDAVEGRGQEDAGARQSHGVLRARQFADTCTGVDKLGDNVQLIAFFPLHGRLLG